MDNRDFSKIGVEIRDAVNQAIDTMDFSKLSSVIARSADRALKEVQDRVQEGIKASQGAAKKMERCDDGSWSAQQTSRTERPRYTSDYRAHNQMEVYEQLYGKGPGGAASVLFTVFGSILSAGFGIPFLVLLAIGIGTASFGILMRLALFFFLPLTAGSLGMLGKGIAMLNRKKRFQRYVRCIGTKTICAIKTLSRAVGKPESYVCNDLQKMIQAGLFRQGHIDTEKTCLMVTDETYELYRQAKERTEAIRKEQREALAKRSKEEAKDARLQDALNEGLRCIEIIRQVNADLPEPVISAKLDRLEKVIGLIYVRIQKSPEKLASMKRFTDYYLPTTIKLVKAYRDFEQSEMERGRVAEAKNEIEQTLDTINLAFERMLDSLYEEDTMDISSDIQVLQTLLAQEGLTDDGLHSIDDVFEGTSGVRKL